MREGVSSDMLSPTREKGEKIRHKTKQIKLKKTK